MKKLLFCMALFGTCTLGLAGCGGNTEPTIVAPVEGPTMSPENQKTYEEQMRSGGSSSAKPGN